MSIVLKEKEFAIISHNDYIKQVYHNIDGVSYGFDEDLFAICDPFKSYNTNSRRNKRAKGSNIADIDVDTVLSVPAKFYKRYRERIRGYFKCKCLPFMVPKKQGEKLINGETNALTYESTDQIEITSKCCVSGACCENCAKHSRNEPYDASKCNIKSDGRRVPNLRALNAVKRLVTQSNATFGVFEGANTLPHPIARIFSGAKLIFPPDCTFYCDDILKLHGQAHKVHARQDVIVIDPPWTNKAIRRKNRKQLATGATNGYSFVDNDDIVQLPIDDWVTQDGVVFMWCTNASAHRSAVDRCFKAWKLVKIAVWYWLKVTTQGEPIIPFASEGSSLKQPYEVVIVGVRTELVTKWRSRVGSDDITEKMIVSVPSAMHSHKPPLVELIHDFLHELHQEERSNYKCSEFFARSLLPGWTSIGNEVLKLQHLCFYQPAVRLNSL